MKSMILLLAIPHITAFVSVEYNGFDRCGLNGWVCDSSDSDEDHHGLWWDRTIKHSSTNEIIFDCSLSMSPNTRVWIWSARFPNSAKTFIVRNCNLLELHVDCTTDHRTSKIQEFRAINITHLVILKTTQRYAYLHDNAPIAHLPPVFHLENVTTRFFSELFQGESHLCTYNSNLMKKFVMKNVVVHDFPNRAFFNATLEELVWTNVNIRKLEMDALMFNGSAEFTDCRFPRQLPSNSISIRGLNVSFVGNTFQDINPNAISVYSFRFNFSNNTIGYLISKGLMVQSTYINIERNAIGETGKDAFSGLSPIYYPAQTIYTVSYRFVGNEFKHLSPLSLHCDWKSYNSTCSTVVIEDNKFDCTCVNLVWMRELKENNNSVDAGTLEFYERLFQTNHHCNTSINCTLSTILKYVCDKNVTLESQCAGLEEKEVMSKRVNVSQRADDTDEADVDYFDSDLRHSESKESVFKTDAEGVNLDKSYYEDRVSASTSSTSDVVPVVVTLFVILILAGIFTASFIWFFRKRKHRSVIEIYKYNKSNDADTLITNPRSDIDPIECENPIYHNEMISQRN